MRTLHFALSLLGASALIASTHQLAAEPLTLSVQVVRTFNYPQTGSGIDGIGQINDRNQFVGSVFDNSDVFGFSGSVAGAFSRLFSEPRDVIGYTIARGINNAGTICGSYADFPTDHGFLRRGKTYKSYDAPGLAVTSTAVEAVNDAGNFVGSYHSSMSGDHAFAVIGGTFITIPVTGLTPYARGINNLDQVVGHYDGDSGTRYGFIRAADGTLTMPISYPGSVYTVPTAINDSGVIVGSWNNSFGEHAFVLQLPDTFLTFDQPGASATSFSGINNAGLICGTYQDNHFRTHGLIVQLQGQ